MPFIFRVLGAGALNGAGNKLYKVGDTAKPEATSAIISNIRVFNTQGASQSVELFVRTVEGGGVQRRIAPRMTVTSSTTYVFNTELTLGVGNLIEVSTSASMECTAFGVERVP